MQIAQIHVFRSTPTVSVIKCYTIEYDDDRDLISCFEEARQVWDEYQIMMVDAKGRLKISDKTYIAEVMESVNL